jgi:hypothetical protein
MLRYAQHDNAESLTIIGVKASLSSLILHPSSFIPHPSSFILHLSSLTIPRRRCYATM